MHLGALCNAALDDDRDACASFSAWMERIVDADTHSLVQHLAGTFPPTQAMYADASDARAPSSLSCRNMSA